VTKILSHIKKDVQKLAYDRSVANIDRICDVFGRDADMLMLAASSAMCGAFLMMYCATSLNTSSTFRPNAFYQSGVKPWRKNSK